MITNNTRCYPRTLQQAFGPYAVLHVPRKRSFFERFLIPIVLVLFVCTVGASVAGRLL